MLACLSTALLFMIEYFVICTSYILLIHLNIYLSICSAARDLWPMLRESSAMEVIGLPLSSLIPCQSRV